MKATSLKLINLLAWGAWHPNDNALIKRILCPQTKQKCQMTPYSLSNNLSVPFKVKEADCKGECNSNNCKLNYQLVNLAELLPPESGDSEDWDLDSKFSTNRIYRIYEGFRSDYPKLTNRYDWQRKMHVPYIYPKIQRLSMPSELEGHPSKKLKEELESEEPKPPGAIVERYVESWIKWNDSSEREGVIRHQSTKTTKAR